MDKAEAQKTADLNDIGLYPVFVKTVEYGKGWNTFDFSEDTPMLDIWGSDKDGIYVEYSIMGEGADHIKIRAKQPYILAAQATNENPSGNPMKGTKVVAIKVKSFNEIPDLHTIGKKLDAMKYACCFSGR
jgi:hypothetical protein